MQDVSSKKSSLMLGESLQQPGNDLEYKSEQESRLQGNKQANQDALCLRYLGFSTDEVISFVRMSGPFTAATAIASIANFMTAKFLSALGEDGLAASGLITSTMLLTQGFLYSPLYAVGVIAGHANGQQDNDALLKTLQQGYIFAGLLSLPLITIYANTQLMWLDLGQKSNIAKITQEFFNGFLYGCYADLFLINTQQYALGVNKANVVFISSLIQKFLTLGVGYCWMFGELGLPEAGPLGMGYGYSIGGLMATMYLITVLALDQKLSFRALSACADFKNRLDTLKTIVKVGLPIGVHIGSETLSLSAMLAISGLLGTTELVTAEIAMQYAGLCVVPIFGASQAGSVLISQALGANNAKLAKQYANACYYIGSILPFIFFITLSTAPVPLTKLFLEDSIANKASIIELCKPLFIILGASLIQDFLRNASIGALRGLKDTVIPMWINLGASIANIALSYLLAFPATLGDNGIFFARDIAITITACVFLWRWIKQINTMLIPTEPQKTTQYASNRNIMFNAQRQSVHQETTEAPVYTVQKTHS